MTTRLLLHARLFLGALAPVLLVIAGITVIWGGRPSPVTVSVLVAVAAIGAADTWRLVSRSHGPSTVSTTVAEVRNAGRPRPEAVATLLLPVLAGPVDSTRSITSFTLLVLLSMVGFITSPSRRAHPLLLLSGRHIAEVVLSDVGPAVAITAGPVRDGQEVHLRHAAGGYVQASPGQ